MKTVFKILVLGVLSLSAVVVASGQHRDRLNSRLYGRFERWFPILQGIGGDSPPAPLFSFAPTSGQGLDSPETLCPQLQPSERVGNWTCMNGDGTFEGAVLAKSGSDVDSTSYVCGGGDVLMASRNPNATAVWSAASTRVGLADLTICSLVKPAAIVGEQALLTWSSSGSGANLGFSPWIGSTGTSFNLYYAFGSPCTNATAVSHPTALVPNAATLLCARVTSSGAVLDLFVNGTKFNSTSGGVGIGCDDGSAQRYNINSWGGVAPQPTRSPILGAFTTEAALSDARIQAISAAVMGVSQTSVEGLPISFTRTSSGRSTKGTDSLRLTGIANGDLVTCSVNQSRLAKGSTGVLRALREPAVTNVCLYSEDFTNSGNWFLANGGSPDPGAITRTSNVAVSPDGTTTADQLDIPAVSGAGYSVVYAAPRLSTASNYNHSLYVRGVSGSGTIYLMSTPGAPSYNSAACNFTSTSWTRCTLTSTETAANWYTEIGVDLRDPTQSAKGAQSVLIWGMQIEEGFSPTSYVPTTSSGSTRSVDNWSVDIGVSAPPGNAMSMAVTVEGKLFQEAIQGYPSAMSAHSDYPGSPTGKGMWLYSNGSFGTSMRCLVADDSGTTYATGVAGGSTGTIRGNCYSQTNLQGTWVTPMTASSSFVGGTWSPARYLVFSGTSSSTMFGLFGEACVGAPDSCR